MNGLAWRLLGRELRSGELRLLFAALLIAVASVTSVGFFADRVRLALEYQAQQLIGGDLVVMADHQLSATYFDEARRQGLQVAQTLTFPSMVMGREQAQLADIKAVSRAYPLRGQLLTADRRGESGSPARQGPQPGDVWLDERLASGLQAGPGDLVTLGRRQFKVAAILTQEPDRGINFFSLAPRLMLNLDDMTGTGLVQFGSRLRYRLLVAGEPGSVGRYTAWLKTRLGRGEHLEDASNARPEIRNALDRAQRFLGLATLLTVILSAVGAALAARRYMHRHLETCAMLRCLGMTQGRMLGLHLLLFFWLALASAVSGSLLGFAAHFGLVGWMAGLLDISLPMPGWLPLAYGSLVAAVLLFGFAVPPLLQLSRVPTLRVLRRELGPPQPGLLGGYGLGIAALSALIVAVAGDPSLGLLAVGGFGVAIGVFWLLARLGISLIGRWRGGPDFGTRQGLANLGRHAAANSLQVIALAIGLMALLLLTVIRAQLLSTWQQSIPADAPNRFVINIQPEQRAGFRELLAGAGIQAELAPMVRARLQMIGQRKVSAADYPDNERAQRLIEREFNLSWRSSLPPGNHVTAGQWFPAASSGRMEASVEAGLADTLGIKVGDELSFSVAGLEKRLRVTSLRSLAWDSMQVNFFVLTPPGVIEDAPASDITSFYLPPAKADLTTAMVAKFPNLTVIDISVILHQLQSVITQVAGAVQFIFLFTLLAGIVVLYSAILSAFDERRYALALIRALGARRAQLRQALLTEFGVIGGLAGLLAALGAMIMGRLIAHRVFDLDLPWTLMLPLLSTAAGALLTMAVGWLVMRRLLETPPLLALRTGSN